MTDIENINQLKNDSGEDFVVSIASPLDESTTLITSYDTSEKIQSSIENRLYSAFLDYDPTNKTYSAFLSDKSADASGLTLDTLNELARNPQSDLKTIISINDYIRFFINADDIIGRTYESIETNVNTDIRLSYNTKSVEGRKQKTNTLEKAKAYISTFNERIGLNCLIRNGVSLAYAEGNHVIYLRSVNDGYVVDSYPLGVAVISDYKINGEPVILIDIKELENRLKKTQLKNKKGKPLFFDGVEKEIQANYPPEVYKAYKDKDNYAVLDNNRAKVIRVNNLNRKYGLTPLFRALKPTLMLEAFAKSDNVNSKAMAKKIIFQKLRKEAMGANFDKKAWEDMAYAHENLVKAWGQSTVVYTGIPQVEDVKYVETATEMINIDTINSYRSRVMVTLGVNFLNTENGQTVTTANISINQLLLTINKITEQIEKIMNGWYKLVLDEQGIGAEYAPAIKIIDSEQMSLNIKRDMVELLFSKLNCSYKTAFELIGMDSEDEKARRLQENSEDFESVFLPHKSQYTSGDGGRPADEEPSDKQDYDRERQESV